MKMTAVAAARPNLPPLLQRDFAENGWAHHRVASDALLEEVSRLGDGLGPRAGGRGGALEETIEPQSEDHAHRRSLSSRHGYNALPFHVELSHRPRPCRYLLLGCIDPGSPGAVTMVVDWRQLSFTAADLHLLESAPVLVRSGRRSFYSTVLPPDRSFLRFDPGCLEAVDGRGRDALDLVAERLSRASPISHHWQRGDLLIIDNWRLLHGRGPTYAGSGRRLVRILVDG